MTITKKISNITEYQIIHSTMAASSRTLHLAIRVSIALYMVLSFFLMQKAHVLSPQDTAAILSQRKREFLGGDGSSGSGVQKDTPPSSKTTMSSPILNELHRPVSEILNNPKLPDWVKNYAKWHKQQRRQYFNDMSRVNNATSDVRFLISRCLANDHCGGASDRLQDIPYNIMLANQTNRVLLVRWEKPAKLENFLVVPDGGIDWTVPDDMFPKEYNWHLRGKEDSDYQIVSTIRRDSAAPKFKNYEKTVLGHRR